MLAWPFAIVAAALSVLCLITVLDCVVWRSVAIFLWALLLAARFLPLSLWSAIVTASATHEGWNFGVIKYYAALAVVWFTVEHFLKRAKDWRLPFLMLWTLAMSAAPVLHMYFDRPILPQAHRFRIELEAAVALLVVLGLRPLFQRLPRLVNAMVALAALLFALNLTLADRRIAKNVLHPADPTQTVEYRTAQRIARDLPGARVMLPGSIAHWANAFTDVVQFGGGEGTSAYSQTQQRALKEVFDSDAESISVLKAYGVAAVVVPGPASAEFWKPFAHPEKFDSLLPVLWSQEGITVYRVPQRSASLAHVAPEPALADASFQWRDQNHIAVRAFTEPGQAIFVQISYHPGWHATIDGHAAEIHRDELGLSARPSQGRTGLRRRHGTAVLRLDHAC
jgi:hypothetical protein